MLVLSLSGIHWAGGWLNPGIMLDMMNSGSCRSQGFELKLSNLYLVTLLAFSSSSL
jgi:hypothetical protein